MTWTRRELGKLLLALPAAWLPSRFLPSKPREIQVMDVAVNEWGYEALSLREMTPRPDEKFETLFGFGDIGAIAPEHQEKIEDLREQCLEQFRRDFKTALDRAVFEKLRS